jgi:hypothetical protein
MNETQRLHYLRKKHSSKRLQSRVDQTMTDSDVIEIVRLITTSGYGQKLMYHRQSKTHTHWLVMHKGAVICVVYDEARMMMVTALPVQPIHLEAWGKVFSSVSMPTNGFGALGNCARIGKLR